MSDLIKAILIAFFLGLLVIMLPIVITFGIAAISFLCVVALIWFLLQVIKEERQEDPTNRR